jgi:hypothetical protein
MTLVRFAAALLALALGSGRLAQAGTLFSDPYGEGAPDVIGNPADFDIRSLEVQTLDPATLAINVRMNYHGGDTALQPFTIPGSSYATVSVGAGDILIQGASSLWALPLAGTAGGPGGIYYSVGEPVAAGTPITRGTLLAGSLYRVTGVLTAGEVLGADPGSDLRADQVVLGNVTTFSPDFVGFVPIAVPLGGGELSIQLQVAIGPAFYNDVVGGYRIHFASSTCACDVLDGVYPAPEPGALALLGVAGGWLWLRSRELIPLG